MGYVSLWNSFYNWTFWKTTCILDEFFKYFSDKIIAHRVHRETQDPHYTSSVVDPDPDPDPAGSGCFCRIRIWWPRFRSGSDFYKPYFSYWCRSNQYQLNCWKKGQFSNQSGELFPKSFKHLRSLSNKIKSNNNFSQRFICSKGRIREWIRIHNFRIWAWILIRGK